MERGVETLLMERGGVRNMITHLIKIGIAPDFPVGEHAGHNPALLVNICSLTHGSALKASQTPIEEVGDVDSCQPTAREPQEGAAHLVINDPQGEFPVVIVDLLCPDIPVIINGQEIPPVDLEKAQRSRFERHIPGRCGESSCGSQGISVQGRKRHDVPFTLKAAFLDTMARRVQCIGTDTRLLLARCGCSVELGSLFIAQLQRLPLQSAKCSW